jgi:hypothetical protein
MKKRRKRSTLGGSWEFLCSLPLGPPPPAPSLSCQKWERFRCLASAVLVASVPDGPTGLQRLITSNFPNSQFILHIASLVEGIVATTPYCFACGRNCCNCAHPFIMFSPCTINDWQNRYSTNRITFLLLCISLLISSNIFRLNCHHQGADTILLKLTATK